MSESKFEEMFEEMMRKAIRFIAIYSRGFESPLQAVILGHGYGDDSGLNHRVLWEYYCDIVRASRDNVPIYPGYLWLTDNRIVFTGGSGTLSIEQNDNLDARLREDFRLPDTLVRVIQDLYPKVHAGTVYHLLLAR